MVTMRVFNTGNGTWIRAWVRQSYGSLQRPAYVKFDQSGIAVGGICSCTVGRSGLCAHVICILHQLIHVTKTGNLKLEIQCTNQPQQWHRRGKKGNLKQYTSVNKVTVKSSKSQVSRETNTAKKNKSTPMKRNLHEKVEQMSEKLNSFEVERHFLLTIGQNKTLCKGGLYPLLADRYITQSAEGDHDYCQPPSSVDKEPAATRNFDLPEPSVIPAQQGNLPATSILYYPVQQRSVQWYHLRTNRITASVIGDLLGIGGTSKFEESWAVLQGKQVEKKKNFLNFQRGIEYEDKARKLFIEQSGRCNKLFKGSSQGYLFCMRGKGYTCK